MATIERYETKKGTRYRVRYRTPDRRQTDRRGFTTKRDAQAFAASVEVSKLKGEFVDVSRSRVAVGALGPAWLGRKVDIKISTRAALESSWKVHVEPRWGATEVSKIEHTDVQQWVAELTNAGKSATTVKRAYGVLSSILDEAVRDRRILHNPCSEVRTPRKIGRQHTFLSHAQLHALANEAGTHRAMVLTMGYTGLRWGEVIGLRVADLDPIRRRLTVNQNAVEVNGKVHVGTPKTHARRSVGYPAFLQDLLIDQARSKLPSALLFPGSDGSHMRRTRTDGESGGWFAGAVRRSGVPRVTPHDLRHTAASLAISTGANVKVVQQMLGHKSAAMTLDIYSGLFPDDLDAVSEALNRAGAQYMHPHPFTT